MNALNRHRFLALVVGLGLVSLLRAEDPKPDRDDTNVLERFTVAKDGDCLLLPVKYKGKTYQFILDSGSTWNVFDSSLPLGSPTDEALVKGAVGAARLKMYDAPEASVGGLSLKAADPVAAFNFTMFRLVSGYEVYGILGMPFLRRHVVRVDFDKGELLVLKEPGRDCGQAFAVTYNRQALPCLGACVVGDNQQQFQLDTGYNGTASLATKLFDAQLNDGRLTVVGTTLSETLSGTSKSRKGQLKQMSLGDSALRGAVVGEGDKSRLGLGFCSRFVMTLDFPNDKVYLKKGKNFDRADAYDLSGLHLVRTGGEVVVHSVDKRSAAEAAGIRAGDLLVGVDDVKTGELSMFQLRQRLSTETTRLCLTIWRGEKETEVA